MSDFRGQKFPRGALYGAGGMIGMTLLVVFGVRLGALPARETAPQHRESAKVAIVTTRDFRFADRADGALVVTDAATEKVSLVLEPGSNSGFLALAASIDCRRTASKSVAPALTSMPPG